jgi:hypothetical protein
MGLQALTADRRLPWALLASLLLHACLLVWWRGGMQPVPRRAPAEMLEVRLLPLAPPVLAPASVPPPAKAARKPGRPAAARPAAIAPSASEAPSVSIAGPAREPVDDAAPPAAPSLTEQARAMAGATDQALRKENPERKGLLTLPLNTPMARFIRALEAAGKPRGTSVTTIRTADGQSITKVTTGSGSYCIYGRSGMPKAATFGTAFDTGYTTGNCPK